MNNEVHCYLWHVFPQTQIGNVFLSNANVAMKFILDGFNYCSCMILWQLCGSFPLSGSNNSSVEGTFSFVTNILSDKRLSMGHNTLENSVIVSGNNSIWSEKEREEIIDRVFNRDLSKHRITTLSSEADSVTKLMMNTMKMTWTVKTNA